MTSLQASLFDAPTDDHPRLNKQLVLVRDLMRDHHWRTLDEIHMTIRQPHASISARLRDLRKPRFGGYQVDRRKRENCAGLYEYRVIPRPTVVTVP